MAVDIGFIAMSGKQFIAGLKYASAKLSVNSRALCLQISILLLMLISQSNNILSKVYNTQLSGLS